MRRKRRKKRRSGLLLQGAENAEKKQRAMEERRERMEETRHSILSQVLDQSARARCKRVGEGGGGGTDGAVVNARRVCQQ